MDSLGMLLLGGFIGGLLCLGLPLSGTLITADFMKLVTFVIASAFTGPVFTWIDHSTGGKIGNALYAYPIGLCLALLWFYVRMSLLNLADAKSARSLRVLAGLHVAAITVITIIAAFIFVFPLIRTIWNNQPLQ